jgi:hypothetical protein
MEVDVAPLERADLRDPHARVEGEQADRHRGRAAPPRRRDEAVDGLVRVDHHRPLARHRQTLDVRHDVDRPQLAGEAEHLPQLGEHDVGGARRQASVQRRAEARDPVLVERLQRQRAEQRREVVAPHLGVVVAGRSLLQPHVLGLEALLVEVGERHRGRCLREWCLRGDLLSCRRGLDRRHRQLRLTHERAQHGRNLTLAPQAGLLRVHPRRRNSAPTELSLGGAGVHEADVELPAARVFRVRTQGDLHVDRSC